MGTKFLVFTLDHDHQQRPLPLIPGVRCLARLRPFGISSAFSPSIYTPPVYGSRAPQSSTGPDLSFPPSPPPQQCKELQVAVGYLLYYGRSVDSRIFPSTWALASEQAQPTQRTMDHLERLLDYVSAHPSGRKIYLASDIVLRVLCDASYLSLPKAGSVAGSFHFLGSRSDPTFVNHPPRSPPTQPASRWLLLRGGVRVREHHCR